MSTDSKQIAKEPAATSRRGFLQKTGLAVVGGTSVVAACGSTETTSSDEGERGFAPEDRAKKKLLITSAQCELAHVIAAELNGHYDLRLTGQAEPATDTDYIQCSLSHDASTRSLVSNIDGIVHLAEPRADMDDEERIDFQTRCTYNLLCAASREGVRHFVYLSSLRVMTDHDERFQIDENWRPRPTVTSGGLADYLGEFTCREFAREGKLNLIVLRLGEVVRADAYAGETVSPVWVDPRDVAHAISRALTILFANHQDTTGHFEVFHIQFDSPHARFSANKAKRLLGYRPRFGG